MRTSKLEQKHFTHFLNHLFRRYQPALWKEKLYVLAAHELIAYQIILKHMLILYSVLQKTFASTWASDLFCFFL